MKKKGLGRGLSSLLKEEDFITDENLLTVDLDKLKAREDQPRKNFDDDSLEELANSIKADGVIQPIVVRKVGDKYEIIAGERRFRASKLAGLEKVPIVVKNVSDRKARELALVENIQREDLNPIEEALSLKTLMEEYKLTQQELSDIIGKSRSYIANNLRLLNLSDYIKDYLIRGELSPSQGRTLLSLETEEERKKYLDKLLVKEVNIRDVEKKAKQSKNKTEDIFIKDICERLTEVLDAKVKIHEKKKGGQIEISYLNEADLQRIIDSLMNIYNLE
ncbi:ParB/RepB/Spo0J family partition protein [Parvimonas micra]|uniref:ParB/RepB/Spo0J family partition protein n=1 Tax=Parvimonas micra TaxID=33033 RepID=A0A9X3HB96_9FIRM|nr:ParB/RepB/Spo0J family partition protein [Parvimonas micra]MCZ7408185.1 ParB/RepB/Spo0J family partition protein [Parvimonas micra]MCZ7411121.1 ParB/RepB/Spo0J family partition protein [Parvimonas micra]MCZ7411888.1 ParB/RepB/Spo0J family partition protein [Parvimonas micra]WBB36970.1 ParB/RepB/Spo0J family partition protein [Parvimonas micra]WBB38491.1 ParB/RepB/Spo0J family partition protein [Parvimonas micra]